MSRERIVWQSPENAVRSTEEEDVAWASQLDVF